MIDVTPQIRIEYTKDGDLYISHSMEEGLVRIPKEDIQDVIAAINANKPPEKISYLYKMLKLGSEEI
ncbi:MAG: hypothetical protein WC783_04290 [Candidatus Paceibacterota bacterium]